MAAFWRAWSIWAVTVATAAAALLSNTLYPLPANLASQAGSGLNGVVGGVFIAAFATVGALLAWKRPGNPIGWLLSATGLAYAAGALNVLLLHFHRTLTLASWLGWTFLLGIGLCVFVVLLFPTGHLPSRRWRPVAWAAGAGPGRVGAGQHVRSHDPLVQPVDAESGRPDRPSREYLQDHGARRRTADPGHGPGRRAVPGVPLPARQHGRTCAAEVAGLRGRPGRGSRARRGARGEQPAERDGQRGRRARPGGYRHRRAAVPAV